jgi:hypothetical protein
MSFKIIVTHLSRKEERPRLNELRGFVGNHAQSIDSQTDIDGRMQFGEQVWNNPHLIKAFHLEYLRKTMTKDT